MSFFKISPDQIETFTIVTNPQRSFVTSSLGAVGSVYVSARRSPAEKDIQEVGLQAIPFSDNSLTSLVTDIQNSLSTSVNIHDKVASYMTAVNGRQQARRNTVALPIERYVPTPTFTENTLRKNVVRKLLFPFYRVDFPSAQWAYTNYHSMNFFTSSAVPTGSVLLYPNTVDAPPNAFVSGTYILTGGFTFDFYVNPRFQATDGNTFKASTLLHLSSCYAVSVVSGSQKDYNGSTQGYRVLLQLSHSADISPSIAQPGTFPKNFVFQSDDNSLQFNTWHHVVIRWGTNTVNHGTGTFWIDNKPKGTFVIPSSTMAPLSFSTSGSQLRNNPDVLCVGNYYEGRNIGTSGQAYFFSANPSLRYGLEQLTSDNSLEEPSTYSFKHPFNAEFHDLIIRNGYMSDDIIISGSSKGPENLDNAVFYLPPFFTPQSPYRQFVGDNGGVLQTPFFASDGYTDDPFNVAMAFGVGGHYINLENFTRDFANDRYPLTLQLSASQILGTTTARSANEFLYDFPQVRRRNVTILPCDDGNFVPNFQLLSSESNVSFYDDLGAEDLSFISLNDLIPTSSLFNFMTEESGSFFTQLAGATPESPGVEPGEVLTIYQRTRDNSSDQVTFFDISNLYYGHRIKPGTFVITDSAITGTANAFGITLKDDGRGNLYRADSVGNSPTWSSVGNVMYSEGIVVIKSPHLQFFGKDGFDVSFKGEQTIHTMRLNVFAAANTLNSSSNVNFLPLSASLGANELDDKFVYISDIFLMDKNFNVLMKTALAQPNLKRQGDSIAYKIRYDF